MCDMPETYVAVVTGGSGFLGQHVVKHLQLYADDIREIRVLDLTPYEQQLEFEARIPVSSITGSLLNKDLLHEACSGADVVFHIASYMDSRFQPDVKTLETINVHGTRKLLDIAQDENVRYFIYCCSVSSVQGYTEVMNGTETSTPLLSKGQLMFRDYGYSKQRAQNMVLEADGIPLSPETRMRTISLIPLTMYGELDRNMVPLGLKTAANNNGTFVRFGSESALCQVAYAGNSAWAFVCAFRAIISRPSEVGGKYFFVPDDTEPQPILHFLKPFMESRDFRYSSFSIPANVLFFFIIIFEFLGYLFSPIYRFSFSLSFSAISFSEKTFYLKYDKAKSLLSYSPLYSPEEAFENSQKYYSKLHFS